MESIRQGSVYRDEARSARLSAQVLSDDRIREGVKMKMSLFKLESRSIEFIPEDERHGNCRSLSTVWFGANMQVATVITGAILVAIGLPFLWAFVATIIGTAIGTAIMALHSAQGPILGMPQMIQSRAQFGYLGAIVPILLALMISLGFYAGTAVPGGQAVGKLSGLPTTASLIALSVFALLLALVGYQLIHRLERWTSVINGIAFIYLTIKLLTTYSLSTALSDHHLRPGVFLLGIAIAATWNISYSIYVADYSRYLPTGSSRSAAFWYTYIGGGFSGLWLFSFGALAASVASQKSDDMVGLLGSLAGHGLSNVVFVVVLAGVLSVNILNLYSGALALSMTAATITRRPATPRSRAVALVLATIIGTTLAVWGQGNFLSNFESFILFLSYLIIPWSAINLIDFYVVRKERYNARAIYDPNGVYGLFNTRALGAYFIAVALEIPFMSTSVYTGPMVARMGGADISWAVGLVVAAVLYVIWMRGHDISRELESPANQTPTETPLAAPNQTNSNAAPVAAA